MRILVTGGCGFIGGHTLVDLLDAGHALTVLDDLSTGHAVALQRAVELTGGRLAFARGTVESPDALDRAFGHAPVDAVIHFAALKSVPESMAEPVRAWAANVGGSVALADAMRRHGCGRVVFSSTAAVYGVTGDAPVDEQVPAAPVSPYARSKLAAEWAFADAAAAWGGRALLLRYFNPVGAHPSAALGEDQPEPTNLAPVLFDVAEGRRPRVAVYGTDYPTPDGTAVRDFIHVVELARAHRVAVEGMERVPVGGAEVYNLGTGEGTSVLEAIEATRRITGRPMPWIPAARRPGDLPSVVADPSRFERDFGFRARAPLDSMIEDGWRWRSAQVRAPWPRGADAMDALLADPRIDVIG